MIFQPTRTLTVLPNGNTRVNITPPAFMEAPTQSVELTPEQMIGYRFWQAGALIQTALPELTDDQREALMTGLGPIEFARVFPEES